MRLRLSDPSAVPSMLAFLRSRIDCIAQQVGEDEVDVSLLGSLRAPHNRLELEGRLRPWRLAHRGVTVEIDAGP